MKTRFGNRFWLGGVGVFLLVWLPHARGMTPECTTDYECIDSNPCTTDECVNGKCVRTPRCESNEDCADDDECSVDHCTPEGCCKNKACQTDEECSSNGDTCMVGVCGMDGCCQRMSECEEKSDCPKDGDLCTIEQCDYDGCCFVRNVICKQDGDPCTIEVCDPETGTCVSRPLNPLPPDCEAQGDCDAGCTPGFWKQPHHLQFWPDDFEPTDRVDAVFGVDSTSNPTLLVALSTGGGGEIAFLRQAVAALLNAAHDEVEFCFTVEDVIELVQEAYDTGDFNRIKDLLEEENERGCTVDKSNGGNGNNGNNGNNGAHGNNGHGPRANPPGPKKLKHD